MATKIKLTMDPADKIMLKRNLNKNGNGQKFLTSEIRRMSDPYVPLLHGPLKNTAVVETDRIIYIQPYAAVNWYTNKGKGKRGKQWVLRMWADRGKDIVKSVANYCGGRAK